MKRFHLRWLLLLVPGVCAAAQEGASDPAHGIVHIVGVTHAPGQLRSPAMSPAHVRWALARLEPEVVCVESDPAWFARGQFYRQTYEAQGVAVPAARAAGWPVYGIDWIGDSSGHWSERQRIARCRLERDRLETTPDPADYVYGASAASQLRVVEPAATADFVHLNSSEYGAERIEWLDSARDEPGTPQAYIAERDAHMAGHIAGVVEQHPRARVVVICGAAHKSNLTRLLEARGIHVGGLDALGTARELRDAVAMDGRLAAPDLVALLTAAYDAPDGVTLPAERLRRLESRLEELARAETRGELELWRDYLGARRSMLAGDVREAASALESVARRETSTAFPHPGSFWRWHLSVEQAARFELGRLADLAGDREAARAHYGQVLAELEVPPWSEDYHSDFEFLAGARNALRALLAQPYRHESAWRTRAAPERSAPRAVATAEERAAAQAQLKQAWSHYRAKNWEALGALTTELEPSAALVKMERLEVLLFAAESALSTNAPERARRKLGELDLLMEDVGPDHWLRPMLAELEARIDARR